MPTPITDVQRQAYLDALEECGVRTDAAKAAGIGYGCVVRARKNDEVFAEAEAEALDTAAESLVGEAWRRAKEGVSTEKFTKDGQRYFETRYSDTLLIFLLKGLRPEVYADRSRSEISAPGGQPLIPQGNTTEAAARLLAIFDEARRRKAQVPDDDDPLS